MLTIHVMLSLVICTFLVHVNCEWHASTVNPGLKIRITQKGIQYAAQEAINVLASDVRGQSIPDQSGSAHVPVVGHISYTVSGMRINSFSNPQTTVKTSPFQWVISNVGASIHGNWKYKNHGWIRVSDHGTFDVSLSGWAMQTTLIWNVDSNGRPTVRSSGCSCFSGGLKVKFHGGASWLYNFFNGNIENALKNQLRKQLCSTVDKAINVHGAKQLASLKVTVALDKMIDLDYRLTKAPVFSTNYMETFHKGEIFWTGERQEAPFSPPPLPDIASTKMVTIWLSQYVMNTLGYVEYKHNTLNYQLTKKDLPSSYKYALDTTCNQGICIGNFIPQLAKKFPNSTVSLDMSVTEAPTMNISSTGVLNGIFTGQITYYVEQKDKPKVMAFSTKLSVTFDLTVAIADLNVTANITTFKVGNQVIVKSNIGKVPLQGVDWVVNMAVSRFVQPKLQELAGRGIQLPSIDKVKYVSPKLGLVKNCLVMETDARYVG